MLNQGFQPPQDIFFDPNPNVAYKIVSVMNGNMCLTVKKGGKHALKIDDYKAKDNQTFKVFNNQGRYAIINDNAALHVHKDSNDDGAIICPDEGQHQSSFMEIIPVGEGQFAGRACFFRTHAGKTFDIQGGKCEAGTDVKQYTFHGGPNQMWVIAPADEKHSNPFQKGKGKHHHQHHNQPDHIVPPNKEVPK